MVDSARYKDWFQSGDKDYKSAKILFEYDGDYGIVAFHCQQAIEKYLKGYLLLVNQQLEKGHSLVLLIKKAQKFDKDINIYMKDCAYINQFYIETRYPADEPMILEKSEAEECLSIVKNMIEYLYEKIQSEEKY